MSKINFLKLTPKTNEKIDTYKEALDYVFDEENDDIKNIAVSGSYGSGKTSVLEAYKSLTQDKKFIHISLAHFNDGAYENHTDISLNYDEENEGENINKPQVNMTKIALLEGRILNQLLHQINPNSILQTDFSVKKNIRGYDIFKIFMPLLLIIISIGYLAHVDSLGVFISTLEIHHELKWISFLATAEALLISIILLISGLAFVLWQIIKMQKQKSIFKKLNIQGNEIEIFSDSKDSFFDKYLDEVIYLFKNSGADVIVFEDIDRYEEVKIFERLREINTLINVSTYKKDKQIKFFYLIRDDVFISKDRAKFFDFILPIVPVVDSSNSYGELVKFFNFNAGLKKPENAFLQEISVYIDDMRLLKNICNEYQIYTNRLNALSGLSSNIMFAMIAYKNIFPKDFSDLQLNKGFIYSLFQRKPELIFEEKTRLEKNIETIKAKVLELEPLVEYELANYIVELESIYAMRLQKKGYAANFNYSYISKYDLNIYPDEFDIRKNIIENKCDNRIEKFLQEIKEMQDKLKDIESYTLQILVKNIDVDVFLKTTTSTNWLDKENKYEQVKASEYFNLLKFLVVEGYLSEDYTEYMSYFSTESISAKDMDFVLSVLNRNKKTFTYALDDASKVLTKMRITRFDQVEILNFDLLEYLLKNKHHQIELERFLKQLRETQHIEFISLYFETNRECELFVEHLNHNWNSFFKYALSNMFTKEQLYKYSILTLHYSSNEDIQLVNAECLLSTYISNKNDYLNIDSPNIDRLIETFKLLKVSFVSIDASISNKDLLKSVYENDLYALNKYNIDMMIDLYYGNYSSNDKQYKNYTIVLSEKESALYDYIESNIEAYIDLIIDAAGDRIEDDESTIITVLNHQVIQKEQKINYIEMVSNKIIDLNSITDNSLWSKLVSETKIKYTEENIINYFLVYEKASDILVDFINNNNKELDFRNIDDWEYTENQKLKFFMAIVSCMSINNEKYKEIISSLGLIYKDSVPQEIEHSKLKILTEEKTIKLTENTLQAMRNTYPDAIYDFIVLNIDEYTKVITPQLFVISEFLELASNLIIDVQIKLKLLQCTSEQISVLGKNYPDELVLAILKSNRDDTEIPDLLSAYDEYCIEIQSYLLDLAKLKIADITSKSISIPFNLIKALAENGEFSKETNVLIFTSQIVKISPMEMKDLLIILGLDEMANVLNSTSDMLVEVSDIHKMILDAFALAKKIYNFEEITKLETIDEQEQEVKYYKVIKSKPPSNELPTNML